MKRGEPLKRKTPMKRGKPIAKQSAKVKALQPARTAAKAAAMERDGGCVARSLVAEVNCEGSLDGHEILPRGRGGSPYELDNILILCRAHHQWVHSFPLRSKELGLLV